VTTILTLLVVPAPYAIWFSRAGRRAREVVATAKQVEPMRIAAE
jgi:hypothetical protein